MVAVEFHFLRLIDYQKWCAIAVQFTVDRFMCLWLLQALHCLQGLDTHIKENTTHAFCYDSRPNNEMKMEWFVRNHLVGGFLNSNVRALCNAKFVTVGDEVFVLATKAIKKGEEVFVHYKVR